MVDIIAKKDEICKRIFNEYKNTFYTLKVQYRLDEFSFKIDNAILESILTNDENVEVQGILRYENNKVILDLYYNDINVLYEILTSDTEYYLKRLLEVS